MNSAHTFGNWYFYLTSAKKVFEKLTALSSVKSIIRALKTDPEHIVNYDRLGGELLNGAS